MEDEESVITDVNSIVGTPIVYKPIKDSSIHTDDLTTSSSDAVIKALQTLQGKIKKLELERAEAEEKFVKYEENSNELKKLIHSPAAEAATPNTKKLHDSRVSILEKQLEYMRRMVQNAENERQKAADKVAQIEQEKENFREQKYNNADEQNKRIQHLEEQCNILSNAHRNAEDKIKDLSCKLEKERSSRGKLKKQTEELIRVTEENKLLMASLSPSLPSSPVPEYVPRKKKRKRPESKTGSCSGSNPKTLANIPFICGKSSSPSHSVTANVQQMLSALRQENPSVCARITTQKKSTGSSDDVKAVILGLEDDLGALTFEFQKLTNELTGVTADKEKKEMQSKLDKLSIHIDTKSQHISKLKNHLKQLRKEETLVRARPYRSMPLSSAKGTTSSNNKQLQIALRASNTKELLSKVKTIRDFLSNKDLKWV